ncbi:MAG: terminase gpP N-terminus-related DNA-binding protein [bacterium]|jgi:hypothetical protein
MANHKKDKEQEAHALYMETNMTCEQIADRIGVNPKTVYAWSRKAEWKVQRAANQVTRKQLIVGYLMQLQKLNDRIALRLDDPIPNSKESDQITKITKAIKSLEKGLTLSDYITSSEEIMRFGMRVNTDATKQFIPVIKEFIQLKARELAKVK